MPPKISIITPLHNKGTYISETIESVLAQTVADWEMIIVENGSTDEGPVIAQEYADKESRIRFLEAPANVRGPGAARNFGLEKASGEWILFLDADDLISPDHLKQLLAKEQDATIIAGGWREMHGNIISEATHRPAGFGESKAELLAKAVALTPWIVHAAIVRRALLLDACGWPEKLDDCPDEDTAFWFKAIAKGEVAWARSCGAVYRKGIDSSRSSLENVQKRLKGYQRIVEANLNYARESGLQLLPQYAFSLAMMYECAYRKAIQAGNRSVADTALREAERWLQISPDVSWHVRIRKQLGIRATNRIRNLVRPSSS